ncbi:MAG TPA: hypothetical protein VFS20_04405 [Longimicrobium sp.]|nr:hypothetical protein [Longimicrobium sp.]
MRSLIRSEPDCSHSIEPFLLRLAQTVARTIERADPANPRDSLRDPSRRPRTLESDYFAGVRTVAGGPSPSRHRAPQGELAGGRLLVYFPDADLCDGAAELESEGFFDVFNAPPWDTWVAFASDRTEPHDSSYSNYLIAYVPPVFVELCSAGIEVNPEQCIRWIEDTDVAVRDLLRRHASDLLRAR